MLFNVETDTGSRLTGYVVPDSFSGRPRITVRWGGTGLLTLEASESRQALVAAGRHATGQCGFTVDETHIRGLENIADLELFDADTGILIYRRRPPGTLVDLNIFRLETHLLPLWRLDDSLNYKFKYWYKGIDRHGRETSTQLFCLNNCISSYASGRLLYKNYEFYLVKGLMTVALLRDPYDELAERLLVLNMAREDGEQLLGARDALIFEETIAFVAELQTFEEDELRRLFRRLPNSVIAALSNPLVRQLTASTPDEMPNLGSIATALDALSSFTIVGLRSNTGHFLAAIADLIGIDAAALPMLDEFPRVSELGERLRKIGLIECFLEKDLELYHQTSTAFAKIGTHARVAIGSKP
jgi:hypothetical protein